MHKIKTGAWRDNDLGPMQVVSGALGKEKVHYEAPDAKRLNKEMTLFLKWFNTQNELDPVIKSGIAHLWFVSIHPFDDDNGRIARAIADMQLTRADEDAQRFYSSVGADTCGAKSVLRNAGENTERKFRHHAMVNVVFKLFATRFNYYRQTLTKRVEYRSPGWRRPRQ